ncbi:NAD-binding protein [Clostridium sp. MB40-C1]|uniref:potassium channel family protein n=1 Tax=Clostridium sp. MB40-C1 TaxID=3070996 RepID=UPI0027E148F3|nr:NAD-binding protein [Clostridium sp. MB40-C1]WMJ79368.1 NAD-binding protein [Clostridium sp. MB40-C1]
MKAIIVGGGKIGYYIFKTLRQEKYDVVLIEKDKERCIKIAEEIDGDIICGDGSDIDVLDDAGIDGANIVAAVTGKDEENLVICQMAKLNFNINKTIARINNPKNRPVFKAFGVDKTVCSTEVIANLIEGEFNNENINIVQTLDRGEMVLLEINISKDSKWRDKRICSLDFPKDCVIASILRNGKVIFPKGGIEIKEGDHVLLVTKINNQSEIEKFI